jgi:hypothetical protein
MKKSKFTEAQIVFALKQSDSGKPVVMRYAGRSSKYSHYFVPILEARNSIAFRSGIFTE